MADKAGQAASWSALVVQPRGGQGGSTAVAASAVLYDSGRYALKRVEDEGWEGVAKVTCAGGAATCMRKK